MDAMLEEEKLEDEQIVEYGTHRTLTEHLYKTLDFLDRLMAKESSKQWPDPSTLRRLKRSRTNLSLNIGSREHMEVE